MLGCVHNLTKTFFPECVASWQGFPFHSGGPGVESVFAGRYVYDRNRSQPFATAHNRPQPFAWGPYGRAYGFLRRVASFCVAGVALREIQTCFVTCRKWFCLAGAILLRRFQKMSFSFRGRRSTLDLTVFIMRGRHSTLEESRFCESHCQGCVQWWQRANSMAGVAFCEMCWKLTEASHEHRFSGSQFWCS